MADILSLEAEPRAKAGKGSARAARRAGRVPAVIYGARKAPEMITLNRNDLIRILNRGGFLAHQFEVKLGDRTERVLPRDIQFHPVTDMPLHVDFLRLAKGATVTVEVPVHFTDHKDSPGLKRGGVLNIVRHEVELLVPATAIPETVEVSLAGLDINDAVKISSVSLPDGCRPTITDRDFTIATITAPSAVKSEAEEAAEAEAAAAEEAEAAEEGEEESEGGED